MCDQALMKGRIGQIIRFVRDSSGLDLRKRDFEHGSAGTAGES
jgi:hypothetical protein